MYICIIVFVAQTGSYQTGSHQKGRFIPPKPKLLYLLFVDTTLFICLWSPWRARSWARWVPRPIYLSIPLSIHLSLYIYIYVNVCVCIYIYIYIIIIITIICIYIYIYIYVYLSIYLSIYLCLFHDLWWSAYGGLGNRGFGNMFLLGEHKIQGQYPNYTCTYIYIYIYIYTVGGNYSA